MRARPLCYLLAASILGSWAPDVWGKGFTWKSYEKQADDWYRGAEGRRIAENLLSQQSDRGSWPKNYDTALEPYRGDRAKLEGTFDNGATFGELRFLARAFRATGDDRDRAAVLKGLDLTLAAQYPSGGFPQHFPTSRAGYDRHITFNDGTMVNILEFLRDVAGTDDFSFVDSGRRDAARREFDRGIACILACQIKVDGKLTAWCAQHDAVTFEPRPARAFELVSLSGGESAGLLLLLMSLERPSPEVAAAIEAGARWFDAVKLRGIRTERRDGNLVVVPDESAPPLWARFYEIGTNRPFFCGRDGVKKYDVAEIEAERRNGYAWYGNWGAKVAEGHARWIKQHGH
jgi:PelA/Pel-15E family pectate lyase